METWMKELGLVMNISDLGAAEDMLEGIADGPYFGKTRLYAEADVHEHL